MHSEDHTISQRTIKKPIKLLNHMLYTTPRNRSERLLTVQRGPSREKNEMGHGGFYELTRVRIVTDNQAKAKSRGESAA